MAVVGQEEDGYWIETRITETPQKIEIPGGMPDLSEMMKQMQEQQR